VTTTALSMRLELQQLDPDDYDGLYSDDFETEEPTWKEARYTPMAELVFGPELACSK